MFTSEQKLDNYLLKFKLLYLIIAHKQITFKKLYPKMYEDLIFTILKIYQKLLFKTLSHWHCIVSPFAQVFCKINPRLTFNTFESFSVMDRFHIKLHNSQMTAGIWRKWNYLIIHFWWRVICRKRFCWKKCRTTFCGKFFLSYTVKKMSNHDMQNTEKTMF